MDLRGLMAKAGEMVQLAERFRQALAERAAAEGEVSAPCAACRGSRHVDGFASLGRENHFLWVCMRRRCACLWLVMPQTY